jgi:hypothetical protein
VKYKKPKQRIEVGMIQLLCSVVPQQGQNPENQADLRICLGVCRKSKVKCKMEEEEGKGRKGVIKIKS